MIATLLSHSGYVMAQDFGQSSWGPIQSENQYPLAQLHLSLSPQSAQVIEQRHSRVTISDAWSSSAIKREGSYIIDGETHDVNLGVVYGLSPGLEVGFAIPFLSRSAGQLDQAIYSWHDFFHLYQGFRDDLPKNGYDISGTKRDGQGFDLRSSSAFGSAKLSAKYTLVSDSDSAWALKGTIGLPASDPAFGQQGLDGLVAILGFAGWQRLFLHWGGAVLAYSDASVSGVDFTKFHGEGFGSIEYRLFDSISLVGSLYGGNKTISNLPLHPNYSLYLDLGSKIRLAPNILLDLLVRENPGASRGSADVTFIGALEFGL